MKVRIIFHLLTFYLLFSPTIGFSQEQNTTQVKFRGTSTKFALMVSDVSHFKAALMTAEEMNVKNNKYNFEIVIVGELVKYIVEDPSLIEDINLSEKLGVKIVMCNNALKFFNVDRSKIDKRIQITKNGWVYMFELSDKGYIVLSV